MKYLKLFEDLENGPDLREIGEFVKCIKTIVGDKITLFVEGEIYKVKHIYGDPQRAIEEFHINDYVPVECISEVEIIGEGDDNYTYSFTVNHERYGSYWNNDFFSYFELIDGMTNIRKYNL